VSDFVPERNSSGSERAGRDVELEDRLLPAPGDPNSALGFPANEDGTIRRANTRFSSNAKCTSSTRWQNQSAAGNGSVRSHRQDGCRDMGLRYDSSEINSSSEEVRDQNNHGSRPHRLGGGTAYALSSTARGHTVIAAHGRDDKDEHHGFSSPMKTSCSTSTGQGIGPIIAEASRLRKSFATMSPPAKPHQGGNKAEEEQMKTVAVTAASQVVHGIGAKARIASIARSLHRSQFAAIPEEFRPAPITPVSQPTTTEFCPIGKWKLMSDKGNGSETLQRIGGRKGEKAASKEARQHDDGRDRPDLAAAAHHISKIPGAANRLATTARPAQVV